VLVSPSRTPRDQISQAIGFSPGGDCAGQADAAVLRVKPAQYNGRSR